LIKLIALVALGVFQLNNLYSGDYLAKYFFYSIAFNDSLRSRNLLQSPDSFNTVVCLIFLSQQYTFAKKPNQNHSFAF
jgi:hypothetical protein